MAFSLLFGDPLLHGDSEHSQSGHEEVLKLSSLWIRSGTTPVTVNYGGRRLGVRNVRVLLEKDGKHLGLAPLSNDGTGHHGPESIDPSPPESE
jgi:hypothetical protein